MSQVYLCLSDFDTSGIIYLKALIVAAFGEVGLLKPLPTDSEALVYPTYSQSHLHFPLLRE